MTNDDNYGQGRNSGNDPLEGIYAYRPERAGYKSRRISIRTVLMVVAVVTAAIVWYAYPRGANRFEDVELPLVLADSESYKILPESRGGMAIPNRDSTVFNPLDGIEGEQPVTILPEAERPIDRQDIDVTENKDSLIQPPSMNLDVNLTDKKAAVTSERAKIIHVPENTPTGTADAKAAEPKVKSEPTPTSAPKPVSKPVEKVEDVKAAPMVKKTHYIQLGAFRDRASAADEYAKKKNKYNDLIENYEVKYEYVDLGQKGVFYRLKLGPMPESEARRVCEKIQTITAGGCIVTK